MVFPSIALGLEKWTDHIVQVLHVKCFASVGRKTDSNVLDADTNKVICYLPSNILRAVGDLDEEYVDIKGREALEFVNLGELLGQSSLLFDGEEVRGKIESK